MEAPGSAAGGSRAPAARGALAPALGPRPVSTPTSAVEAVRRAAGAAAEGPTPPGALAAPGQRPGAGGRGRDRAGSLRAGPAHGPPRALGSPHPDPRAAGSLSSEPRPERARGPRGPGPGPATPPLGAAAPSPSAGGSPQPAGRAPRRRRLQRPLAAGGPAPPRVSLPGPRLPSSLAARGTGPGQPARQPQGPFAQATAAVTAHAWVEAARATGTRPEALPSEKGSRGRPERKILYLTICI